MELSVLYRDAQTLDARIYPYNIGFAGAATVEVAGRYGIFVDFDRLGSLQEFKAALAHELGHCMTGSFYTISTIDNRGRMEERANRWAIKTLLPFSKLNEAVVGGIYETYDLADYFDLPESFIKTALNYYLNCRGLCFNDKTTTNLQ